MFHQRSVLQLAVVGIGLMSLTVGCGALLSGNYLITEGKGDIALVSFSIDRNISADWDTVLANRPTLAEEEKLPVEHWSDHQAAVDAMYAQFKGRIADALLDAPMLPFEKVEGNPAYLAASAHKVKLFMGTDIGTGIGRIPAKGLNYVSPFEKPVIDSLCAILGVNLLFSTENKAFFRVMDSVRKVYRQSGSDTQLIATVAFDSSEFTRGLLGIDNYGIYMVFRPSDSIRSQYNLRSRDTVLVKKVVKGSMELTCSAYLMEKGKGLVWSRNHPWLRTKTLVEFDDDRSMKTSDYAAQLTEALEGVYENLKADARRGKQYAAQSKEKR